MKLMIPQLLLLLLGFLGILSGMVTIVGKIVKKQNILPGILLIFISYDIFLTMLVKTGFWELFPFLLFSNWVLPISYGPLFYLFVLYLLTGTRPKWFHFLYFLPFLLFCMANEQTIFANVEKKQKILNEFLSVGIGYLVNDLEWIFHSFYNLIFLFLAILLLKKKLIDHLDYNGFRFMALVLFVIYLLQLIYILFYYLFNFGFEQHDIFMALEFIIIIYLCFSGNGLANYKFKNT